MIIYKDLKNIEIFKDGNSIYKLEFYFYFEIIMKFFI